MLWLLFVALLLLWVIGFAFGVAGNLVHVLLVLALLVLLLNFLSGRSTA
jgi:hypothetical protein